MSRKSVLLGFCVFLLLSGVVSTLLLLLRHEPEFYRASTRAADEEKQKKESGAFITAVYDLIQEIKKGEHPWSGAFSDESINSFFAKDFARLDPEADQLLRSEGISAPRISIEPERIRLAFRYRTGHWSTIVSIDMSVWLAGKERNVLALELQSLHAGSLPISAQSLLERISETAHQQNLNVTWYRHNGNPVALLRFEADQRGPAFQLQNVELRQGEIRVSGKALELSASLPKDEMTPAAN